MIFPISYHPNPDQLAREPKHLANYKSQHPEAAELLADKVTYNPERERWEVAQLRGGHSIKCRTLSGALLAWASQEILATAELVDIDASVLDRDALIAWIEARLPGTIIERI